MSYGMHDYLAEKAMQRQDGISKKAGILEFLGIKTPSDKPGLPVAQAYRKGLEIDLNADDEARERAAEVMHDNGTPVMNEWGVPIDENGKVVPGFDYKTDKYGAPIPSLRDRIIQKVMANKYAIGGALGAGGAGATIGALSSNENRLRNVLLGGGIGAILGGVSGHIADRFIS